MLTDLIGDIRGAGFPDLPPRFFEVIMNTSSGHKTIKTADIVYREDIYPRIKHDPALVQKYAQNLEVLPPIEVNQHNELIDGWHRWTAYKTNEVDSIPVTVTTTKSDVELLALACLRNAAHGLQLTEKDKSSMAKRLYNLGTGLTKERIAEVLSVTPRSVNGYLTDIDEQLRKERKEKIEAMWLRCYETDEIAAEVGGIDARTVELEIVEIRKKGKASDVSQFYNFEPQLYSIWNFPKATNEVKHPGNIPPEICDNLLYYYTKPGDVIFDPFGGGGSTLDICERRMRRCYISDLNPIPARERDIRQHDITTGLPKNLPVPDFVFLDPPYWQQAKHKYSKDETDLGNVDLEMFLTTIGNIARDVKSKWRYAKRESGYLSLIIGPWKEDGEKIDLALLCYERISKYLPLCERIIVPYSTEVHGGAFVNKAKEAKQILYLHRDLMVFKWNQSKNQNDS